MAKIYGKLKRDIRINGDGKEDGGGRLFLRGEFASVDESIAAAVDPRAVREARRRITPDNKQSIPPNTKET